MPLSPQITLTGNFADLTGVADPTGKVVFTLVNFGDGVARVPGTTVISPPGFTVTCVAGAFSVTIWGNDVIVPSNTRYQVKFIASDGSFCGENAYQFSGTVNSDLSSIAPYQPSSVTAAAPNAVLTNPSGVQTISTYALNVPELDINGTKLIVASGTPSAGQVPVAQSSTAAAWQTLASTQNLINVQSYGTGVGAAKGVRLAATISSGSPNLSIAAGTKFQFVSGDVGKNIVIEGSGAGSPNFYATIQTFTNATHVVLNANAPASYSNVTAVWWTAGQDTTDRQALEAASTAQDTESGILYSPEAFYLYDQTPSLDTTKTKGLIGDGIRSTFWVASNANAGSFLNMTTWPRWTRFEKMSIYGPGYVAPSLITNVALTSNVATITAANGFAAGNQVIIQLLTTANGKLLNHQVPTVISTGLSGSQFEFNYTHADIGSTADTGLAYKQESAIVTGNGGAWYQKLSELEIYNFQGAGVEGQKLIFPTWDRVWIHNCATPYTIFVQPPTAVGCTGMFAAAVYGQNCYAPPILYYCQEGSWNACYSEGNGGGWILDFCQGVTFNGCAVEQPTYQNATVPGKFWELRTCRAVTVNGGFCITDSGGNAAQTFIALNTNGTIGSNCQHNSFNNVYLTTSGNTPTYVVAFEDSTVTWNRVYEPYWGNGNFTTTFLDNTTANTNNSFIYKGDELSQGLHTTKISANAGNAALTAITPTAATNGANKNSPDIVVSGRYFDGAASQIDQLKIRSLPHTNGNNPVMDLDFAHVGSSGGWQITVAGTPVISSAGAWLGTIGGAFNGTTVTASGLITANAGLTVSASGATISAGGFTVAAGQKTLLTTQDVSNSPAVTGGAWVASSGWGNTAVTTVQANSKMAAGRINVLCQGTGITTNPTLTLTFVADTNSNTPNIQIQDESANLTETGSWVVTSINASTAVVTYRGTVTTAHTYALAWAMVFRG